MNKDNSKIYLIAGVIVMLFAMGILFYPVYSDNTKTADGWDYNKQPSQDDSPPKAADNDFDVTPEYSSSSSGINEDPIYDVVEQEPQFIGGEIAMQEFIKRNIRYPDVSIEMRDQGKVYVRFVVEKNGEITNVTIARSVSPELDKESMRVIRMMPKWEPGKHRNKPERTYVVVPIVFKLM